MDIYGYPWYLNYLKLESLGHEWILIERNLLMSSIRVFTTKHHLLCWNDLNLTLLISWQPFWIWSVSILLFCNYLRIDSLITNICYSDNLLLYFSVIQNNYIPHCLKFRKIIMAAILDFLLLKNDKNIVCTSPQTITSILKHISQAFSDLTLSKSSILRKNHKIQTPYWFFVRNRV